MPTRKEIARFLRLAVGLRLLDARHVDRWVDSIIAEDSTASFPFTDLAGATNLRTDIVERLLEQVPGVAQDYLPGRMVIALIRRRLRNGSIAPEAAIKFALQMGNAGEITEAERDKADHLDDSVWLATHDTYGTLEEIRHDIQEYFEKYAEFDAQIPTY